MADLHKPHSVDALNPDWHDPMSDIFDDQWEPWEPDEGDELPEFGCAYCGAPDVRDLPEPFGGKRCCDPCFNQLIGGDRDDPPWRCGTAHIDGSGAAL